MRATFPEVEFLRILFSFKKMEENPFHSGMCSQFVIDWVVLTVYWYSLSSGNDVSPFAGHMHLCKHLLFSSDATSFQQTNPSVRFWPYWLTRTYTNHIWSSWYNGSLGKSKFRDSAFIDVWYSEKANQSYFLKNHINQCKLTWISRIKLCKDYQRPFE